MHPADIQAELKKHGFTQKKVAQELKVCEMLISKVIREKRGSDRVMKGIASRIGRDHRAIFPEYYFGPRKRRTSKSVGPKVY